MLIDVVIPGDRDRNVMKKEAEKILKYKDRITEIRRMWNVRATLIPVTIRYLRNKPGKHEIEELKKTAILGTAHILLKVLM